MSSPRSEAAAGFTDNRICREPRHRSDVSGMDTTRSADGTTIAYDRSGSGTPLILVNGAISTRSGMQPYAEALAPDFTVITYDRRGRGDSSDTSPYAVAREIQDLAALIDAVGG